MSGRSELRKLLLLVGFSAGLATGASVASAAFINFLEGANDGPFTVSTNMFDTVITIDAHGATVDGIHRPSISPYPISSAASYIGGLLDRSNPDVVSALVVLTAGSVYFPPSGNFQPIHVELFSDDQLLTDVIAAYGVSVSNFLIEDGSLQDISDAMGTLVDSAEGIRIRIGVTEPATLAVLGVGLAGLGFSLRRKLN